jgi:hypothetical protein
MLRLRSEQYRETQEGGETQESVEEIQRAGSDRTGRPRPGISGPGRPVFLI